MVLGVLRCLVLCLSFAFSSLAAAAFLTFVLFLNADTGWLAEDPLVAGGTFVFATVTWLAAMQLTFIPAFVVFAVLEFGRLTSLTMNLMAGGFVALSLLVIPTGEMSIDMSLPYTIRETWTAIIASGFVAGFIHWLLAGHRSGRWLGPAEKDRATEI